MRPHERPEINGELGIFDPKINGVMGPTSNWLSGAHVVIRLAIFLGAYLTCWPGRFVTSGLLTSLGGMKSARYTPEN